MTSLSEHLVLFFPDTVTEEKKEKDEKDGKDEKDNKDEKEEIEEKIFEED